MVVKVAQVVKVVKVVKVVQFVQFVQVVQVVIQVDIHPAIGRGFVLDEGLEKLSNQMTLFVKNLPLLSTNLGTPTTYMKCCANLCMFTVSECVHQP